jgi:gliding motility-associated-like protein
MLESNPIDPAIAYVNETPITQVVWVRVESADNGGCFGIGPIMELTVNRMPEFELNDSGFLCLNDPPFVASTYNPEDNYLYNWFDETGALIGQQPSVEINAGGTYTVIATSFSGCSSFAKEITVIESVIPQISKEDINIIEDGDTFIISVNDDNQNLGVGDYEYALNYIDGLYQDSPDIYDVYPGVHTLYVRDKNGCGLAQTEVHVLGFPSFFTPNNDGVNDYWNVRGIDYTIFSNAIIQIFDRYGKHIATFDANQLGWDGMYNDSQAISSDYWFTAALISISGQESNYKGHFSLVRR